MLRCRIDHGTGVGASSRELVGLRERFEAHRHDEVAATIAEAEAAAEAGAQVIGFVAYDAAPAFEPSFELRGRDEVLPLAWFASFDGLHEVEPLEPPALDDGPAWHVEIDERAHALGVEAVQASITEGDAYLVNFTTRLRRPWREGDDALQLYARLVAGYGSGQHALIETDAWAVACGSPELFFELRGRRVTTRPVKGTAARGRWSEEDLLVADALACSAKERAENVMVVDLLRNDLGRLALPGTTSVPSLASLEQHPSLWQLTSTVQADLPTSVGLAEVFGALFPCASVTGAPKIASMAIIAELEASPRGLYCGAVGTISPSAQGPEARFSVAIRSAVVDKLTGEVAYGSGGGISSDSVPAAEWSELLLKASALTAGPSLVPAAGPGLIETMGFDPACGIRNLARHLSRLRGSASYLGLEVPGDLELRLDELVRGLQGPSRVRLVLEAGGVELEASPLTASASAPLRLALDPAPVDSRDPGLFHKGTDRHRYEERAARHPGADDVVLVNERGELTETTRANLAVLLGGRWYTPQLSCGLLPGVERARLLEEGLLTERVLRVEDLERAEGLATCSSLRGWLPAVLLEPVAVVGAEGLEPPTCWM